MASSFESSKFFSVIVVANEILHFFFVLKMIWHFFYLSNTRAKHPPRCLNLFPRNLVCNRITPHHLPFPFFALNDSAAKNAPTIPAVLTKYTAAISPRIDAACVKLKY